MCDDLVRRQCGGAVPKRRRSYRLPIFWQQNEGLVAVHSPPLARREPRGSVSVHPGQNLPRGENSTRNDLAGCNTWSGCAGGPAYRATARNQSPPPSANEWNPLFVTMMWS